MENYIAEYVSKVNDRFKSGISREHSYRGDLQQLLENLVSDVLVTNEPARIECGAPDYILTKKEIPVGYIEAKDIGKDLKSKDYKEQFERYKKSLNNLIFTDYLDFHLYKDGEFVTSIAIAEIVDGEIKPIQANNEQFSYFIKDFASHYGQTIKSASKLSIMMADKARLLAQVIAKALNSDEKNAANSTLKEQMNAFKEILIHDIKPSEFADIYAQTIAYGMFAARLHDDSLDTFSRQEAANKIPKSNPFLRKLFQYIAGYDLDHRINWIVDELADVFRATDVKKILNNFGKLTQQNDPIIHFYETFLAEYDPKLRKSRGVWYTPEPVVNFIVEAVDHLLKSEFGLANGLGDTSKTKVKVNVPTHDKRSKSGFREYEQDVHKVQILDPATGTGTFLAQTIKHIHEKFKGQAGIWNSYVENHLIPRINGFELLMASYAMAHLKLDLLLSETGFIPTKDQRLRVYLTNSLEEHHQDTGTLFANWLSTEANEANIIKRDTPVMCIIGNPPYSGESSNKGEWIMSLMDDYKKEPGGKEKLKERNPKWINDDYVKFLRYGQHYIDKNGSGVLAFINPHGFLDNPTFRGMRWNLLKTYDKIYVVDLHGNSKKKETTVDGKPDVNVFDIQQGVSINILVKTGKKKANELGKVFHFDLYGKREHKYEFLEKHDLNSINFTELVTTKPNFYFVQKGVEDYGEYVKGFSLNELFPYTSMGIVTSRDKLVIDSNKENLKTKMNSFFENDLNYIRNTLKVKENSSFKIMDVKNKCDYNPEFIKKISYRPFDEQYIYFDSANFIERGRGDLMNHFDIENESIVFRRQQPESNDLYVFTSAYVIADGYIRSDNKGGETIAPLFLNKKISGQQTIDESNEREVNLNSKIAEQISSTIGLKYSTKNDSDRDSIRPIDILNYIYSVLHSPSYRDKFKEFLKIDYPRVPYPINLDSFWQLVELGEELRKTHLFKTEHHSFITSYPIDGSNVITKKLDKNDWELGSSGQRTGRIWINDEQYFDDIPIDAWELFIGGYQPAHKWLKDRKGKELSFEDILHYQKIIIALNETHRLMQEIDKIEFQ